VARGWAAAKALMRSRRHRGAGAIAIYQTKGADRGRLQLAGGSDRTIAIGATTLWRPLRI